MSGAERVILFSRNRTTPEENRAYLKEKFPSTQIDVVPLSLDDESNIASFWEKMDGKVDILVLNAAYSPHRGPSEDITTEDASQAMLTNIIGNWTMARCYLEHSKKYGIRGTIVDVSSGASHVPYPRNSVYGASKAGATFLLRSLA